MVGDDIVRETDDLVDQKGLRERRGAPGGRVERQPPRDLCPPGVERVFERQHQDAPPRAAMPRIRHRRIERVGERAPVDNGAAIVKTGETVGHGPAM